MNIEYCNLCIYTYIYVTDCAPHQACIALFSLQRMSHLTDLVLEEDGFPLGFRALGLGLLCVYGCTRTYCRQNPTVRCECASRNLVRKVALSLAAQRPISCKHHVSVEHDKYESPKP